MIAYIGSFSMHRHKPYGTRRPVDIPDRDIIGRRSAILSRVVNSFLSIISGKQEVLVLAAGMSYCVRAKAACLPLEQPPIASTARMMQPSRTPMAAAAATVDAEPAAVSGNAAEPSWRSPIIVLALCNISNLWD